MAIRTTHTGLVGYTQKANVLLLDTDSEFLLLLEQYLRIEGYFTEHIETLRDAVHFAPSFSPHVILCAVPFAPYLREIVTKIRALHAPFVPKVVMLSNSGTLEDIRYAMKLGADDCISKTVSPEFIAFAIEALFDTRNTL